MFVQFIFLSRKFRIFDSHFYGREMEAEVKKKFDEYKDFIIHYTCMIVDIVKLNICGMDNYIASQIYIGMI